MTVSNHVSVTGPEVLSSVHVHWGSSRISMKG